MGARGNYNRRIRGIRYPQWAEDRRQMKRKSRGYFWEEALGGMQLELIQEGLFGGLVASPSTYDVEPLDPLLSYQRPLINPWFATKDC